ncbi:MAG: hypothetical protein HN758_14675 [Verrucomicrobia bacterium]|nr:hypothetical protein [Verrucomicrobiota bacterium]
MTNASDFQLLTRKLNHLVTAGIIAGLLSGAILHGQEQSKSKPQLSKATLEILEAQVGQAILEAPEAQVSEETLLNREKKKKIETGGLLKEWFAPFEKKHTNHDQPQKPAGRVKRKPLWSWFNPTAPMSKSELQAEPIDWKGSRKTPQRFGNREKQEPEGWAFFFLRY